MPKKQQQEKGLSSFYFRFLQPADAIIRFLESAVSMRFSQVPYQGLTVEGRWLKRGSGSEQLNSQGWALKQRG